MCSPLLTNSMHYAISVFMSPETATSDPWRKLLHRQGNIAVVAIDEAHCISERWVTYTVEILFGMYGLFNFLRN